mgnify:FL=1
MALSEDIGTGDLSSDLLDNERIKASIICREKAVICGVEYSDYCFTELDPSIEIDWKIKEGEEVMPDTIICQLIGRAQAIISTERTALNFLQTLSATATQTRLLFNLIKHTKTQLLDTRKTIPNLRHAQKYAVKCGGGVNHRMGLYDCIMLKENHIMAIGSIEKSIELAQIKHPEKPIIVEVETLEELQKTLKIDRITRVLCDNFSIAELTKAVSKARGVCQLEASGNIDENNIVGYAETGVDYISIGAITKHINAIDLSLQFD